MKAVNISGTIVDAWFDNEYFSAELDAGVITPVSRFTSALRAALEESADPVEIVINSTGGDVYAGLEMLAAIQDAGDRIARVTIGGLAASMAANIAIMARRPLAVHSNSLIYFHSATSDLWGGPGALRDEAELLDRVNGPEIARLIEAGIDETRVKEGFKDGRNLVVDADEARQYFDAEIIGADAPAPVKPDAETIERMEHPAAALDRLAEHTGALRAVVRLAAWTPEMPAPEAPADPAPVDAAPEAPEAPADPAPVDAALSSLEKQLRAVQSGASKKIASLSARVAELKKERDNALAELAKAAKRADELAASLDTERTARAELVGIVTSPESDLEIPPTATPHIDRLAALRTVDERLAYAAAHKAEIAAERKRAAAL